MFKQRISLNVAVQIHEFPPNEKKSQGDAEIVLTLFNTTMKQLKIALTKLFSRKTSCKNLEQCKCFFNWKLVY